MSLFKKEIKLYNVEILYGDNTRHDYNCVSFDTDFIKIIDNNIVIGYIPTKAIKRIIEL